MNNPENIFPQIAGRSLKEGDIFITTFPEFSIHFLYSKKIPEDGNKRLAKYEIVRFSKETRFYESIYLSLSSFISIDDI